KVQLERHAGARTVADRVDVDGAAWPHRAINSLKREDAWRVVLSDFGDKFTRPAGNAARFDIAGAKTRRPGRVLARAENSGLPFAVAVELGDIVENDVGWAVDFDAGDNHENPFQ